MKYQRHSSTSKAAAASIVGSLNAQQSRVQAALAKAGLHGMTDQEMQRSLGMAENTQRPRRIELMDRGLVIDSGRKRKTISKRNATVWILRKYLPNVSPQPPRKRRKEVVETQSIQEIRMRRKAIAAIQDTGLTAQLCGDYVYQRLIAKISALIERGER